MKTNGEATDATVTIRKHLSPEEKIDMILEILNGFQESLDSITDSQAEIVEKLTNMELPWGDGFNSQDRYGGN